MHTYIYTHTYNTSQIPVSISPNACKNVSSKVDVMHSTVESGKCSTKGHYAFVSQHHTYGDYKRSILFAVRKPFWQGICSVKLYSMLAYIYENNYMQLASCSREVRASKAAVSKRKHNSARYQPGYFSLLPTGNIVPWTKKLLIHDTNPLVTYPATYRSISLSQRGTITASVTPPVFSRFWQNITITLQIKLVH